MEAQEQFKVDIKKTNVRIRALNQESIKNDAVKNELYDQLTKKMRDSLDQVNALNLEKAKEMILAYNKRVEMMVKVTRSFELNGFGIYNCDRILKQEGFQQYAFEVNMPKEVENTENNAYVIYKNIRSVVNNYYDIENKTSLDLAIANPLECKIIIVIDDKNIAVCNGINIQKAIEKGDDNLAFEIKKVDINKESLAEIFTF